jgi:hypothetical protein
MLSRAEEMGDVTKYLSCATRIVRDKFVGKKIAIPPIFGATTIMK